MDMRCVLLEGDDNINSLTNCMMDTDYSTTKAGPGITPDIKAPYRDSWGVRSEGGSEDDGETAAAEQTGLSISPFFSHAKRHTCLSTVWTEHPQKISTITNEDEGDFVDWCSL